jgi:hypothetical protein
LISVSELRINGDQLFQRAEKSDGRMEKRNESIVSAEEGKKYYKFEA